MTKREELITLAGVIAAPALMNKEFDPHPQPGDFALHRDGEWTGAARGKMQRYFPSLHEGKDRFIEMRNREERIVRWAVGVAQHIIDTVD